MGVSWWLNGDLMVVSWWLNGGFDSGLMVV